MKLSNDFREALASIIPLFYQILAFAISLLLVLELVIVKAQQTQAMMTSPTQYKLIIDFLGTPLGSLMIMGSFSSLFLVLFSFLSRLGNIFYAYLYWDDEL